MTRVEALWILSLSLLLLWIILASLNSDRTQSLQRVANQHMEYLAGQFRFTMGVQAEKVADWPDFLVGPGASASAGNRSQTTPLQTLLPAPLYLPTDPWGGAYVIRKEAPNQRWFILCSGPDPALELSSKTAFLQLEIYPPAP